jgi:hypothetical protein
MAASMFDPERDRLRRPLLFLHKLVAQLSRPARVTHEQIDYVPTQVDTEYLLRIFAKGKLVVGLLYASALTGDPPSSWTSRMTGASSKS